jgi:uncharacterized protein with PIN domain
MRFATDATLGKLGRHLRAAGFDTVCQHERGTHIFFNALETDRIILTRTVKVQVRYKHRPLLFIRDNDPIEQMIQVFKDLNIGPADINPFSRCLICNLEITPIEKQYLQGKVPVFIWQHHQKFYICNSCKRIYWSGSHHRRLTQRFETLFKIKDG